MASTEVIAAALHASNGGIAYVAHCRCNRVGGHLHHAVEAGPLNVHSAVVIGVIVASIAYLTWWSVHEYRKGVHH